MLSIQKAVQQPSSSFGMRSRRILSLAVVGLACSLSGVQGAHADGTATVALVGGDLTDPFFGALKKGADDAAHDLGVKLNYIQATIVAPDLARALQTAIASKPAGIAYGDWFPNAEDPLVSEAAKAGIPVVAVNAAPSNWSATGAMALIGQSDYDAGALGGQLLAKAGAKHGICVNHAPGASNIEQRCSGFADAMKKAGGVATVLNIPYSDVTNPGKVAQAIQGALSSDQKVDGIFACNASIAVYATRAVEQQGVGGKVKVGSIDLSTALLQAIKDGKVEFTIDQQPYLQGYYAVSTLAQNAKYGMHLVGQVKTGPLAINKANVESVLNVNRNYHGIRGAL
ncbi:sugar ABC transporter substrate-binding protein [Paraburkholderia bannensis]|uniref:sugar ABC transporter substrate-binding protein n=1 Tax=Paraburkholderia bannensis TaxID=765414 RepID=UPI002AC35DF2|nr:sugar ABC transporter substrate-binding protein [Paraburkholderia bannensis]